MADLRHQRAVAALAVIALWSAALLAFERQPPAGNPPATPASQDSRQPQQPTFRTGTDVVRVDVTVLDKKGLPTSALTADDFEVFEDDEPQSIQSFKFVALSGHPEEGDENSLPIRSRAHAAAEAARDEVRVFLIFWDEYHIGRFQPALLGREYLMKFVREAFGPTDLVAFMDPLTTTEAIRFTRDRLELAETVRKLRGRRGEYMPVRSAIEESHLMRGDVERVRSEVSISALKAGAVFLGSLRQGRKSIILISEGMRGMRRDDERAQFQDLIEAANDSNVAFHSINPLGLQTGRARWSPFDWLETLSVNTGGEFTSSNDYRRALDRVVTQSSAYYLIGYAPKLQRFDGKFHKIRVRVKKPGFEIRARSGYWAPSVSDMKRAEKIAEEAVVRKPVDNALAELPPAVSRRSIDMWVGTGVAASGRAQVRLAWAPRELGPGEKGETVATVSVVATGESGEVFKGDVTADGGSFEAPPGRLELAMTALNDAAEIIDRDKRTITVPDPSSSTLWISSPVVVRTSKPAEFRAAKSNPSATPAAGREFNRNERLLIRFDVHGANGKAAAVAAQIKNRRGESSTTLRVEALQAGGYEIELPLISIARGEYLVAIEATHGDERAESFVPIRLMR